MKLPPLASASWWSLPKTLAYCRARAGHRDLADHDFLTAVNDGWLHTKIEQLSRRTKPPTRTSCLLTPKLRRDHELTAHINDTWILQPRAPDIPPITPPYALFFWAPDMKQIWPQGDAHEQPDGAAPQRRRRPGKQPKHDWPIVVARELIRRAKLGERNPTAPKMLQFCEDKLGWQPDIRQMQKLLKELLS